MLRTGKVDLTPKELTRLEIIQLVLDSELAREKAEKELAQVKELSNQKSYIKIYDTVIQ
ncbi:hypothetical protein [Dyadobacter sp. 3J3]|uniref:hypothetical protein n=1 Tax=Dyadobacter sp. 3J3 TaxID=2606600 RepID=UPI0013591F80|nr:hypothetical protein [Dyadobacter sp. 3J3]